jgi:hypothetical protein
MTDCPNCEYHKQRAQRWREEAYRQAGHPLPEREWVGLTDKERNNLWRDVIKWGDPSHDDVDLMKAIETKLKERNG